jgi:hypothetical protein
MTNKLADFERARAQLAGRAGAFAKLDALDEVRDVFARVRTFDDLQLAYKQFAVPRA